MPETATSAGDRILTERRGHVLVVTINRPEARNAFDRASAEAMHAAMDLLDQTDELFVGVVTGAGGTFSAGADLKAVARGESARSPRGGFGMFARPSRKSLNNKPFKSQINCGLLYRETINISFLADRSEVARQVLPSGAALLTDGHTNP